jgi:U3 small nucleolar RNA-associated protein 11
LQGGVHIQDRGNTALPVDVVKVLKTQDENYIRTMRHAGLKVSVYIYLVTTSQADRDQKIDRIKEQLTPLADLVRPTTLDSDILMDEGDELDEQEVQVLQQAGVLKKPSSKSKGRTSARSASKHVVFTDDLDAGKHAWQADEQLLTDSQLKDLLVNGSLLQPPLTRRIPRLWQALWT